MKRQILIGIVGVFLASVPAPAQAQGSQGTATDRSIFGKVESYRKACLGGRLEKQLLLCLGDDLEVIVEGALREIARIKLAQPACVSPAITAKLHELSDHASTPEIRYKASLTQMLFEHPDYFTQDADVEFRSTDEMFTAISRKIEQRLLANSEEIVEESR